MIYKAFVVVRKEENKPMTDMLSVFVKAETLEEATQKVREAFPQGDLRSVSDEPLTIIL